MEKKQYEWIIQFNVWENQKRESGLVIMEIDLTKGWAETDLPQLYKHDPSRDPISFNSLQKAYRPGDVFTKCFQTECITIEPISSPNQTTTFSVTIGPL